MALTDGFGDPEMFKQNLQTLLTWVCEIEELVANQKPPSSEFKVVKAQVQEQKVRSTTSILIKYSSGYENLPTRRAVNSTLKFF